MFKNLEYDDSKKLTDNVLGQEWLGFTPFETPGVQDPDDPTRNKNRCLYFNPITGGPASMIAETETYLDNQVFIQVL